MPDRYFEKIGSDFDVTKIQYNLTQKLYYLIERIKYHYNIDINYPIFENINLYNIEDVVIITEYVRKSKPRRTEKCLLFLTSL